VGRCGEEPGAGKRGSWGIAELRPLSPSGSQALFSGVRVSTTPVLIFTCLIKYISSPSFLPPDSRLSLSWQQSLSSPSPLCPHSPAGQLLTLPPCGFEWPHTSVCERLGPQSGTIGKWRELYEAQQEVLGSLGVCPERRLGDCGLFLFFLTICFYPCSHHDVPTCTVLTRGQTNGGSHDLRLWASKTVRK
jgi:hypothetical protein